MFQNLKKKLQSFLGKPETKEEKPQEKPKKKPEKKEKPAKAPKTPKKTPKPKPTSPTKSDLPLSTKPDSQLTPPEPQDIQSDSASTTEPDSTPTTETPKSSFFSKFTKSLSTSTLKKEQIEEIFEPLELILLENNVALEAVDKIHENLIQDLEGIEIKKHDIEKTVTSSLKESISSLLIEPPDFISEIKKRQTPYVIAFFGINGSGKTTSLAKLAHKLKKENISCVFAAADTFRAASIEQLQTHASKLDIKLIKHDYGSDPTAVAFDAKKYAEKNNIQAVLIDTAGRMYTKDNLIKEMEKLIKVIKPDLKIFVGESITGNDATQQAKTFNEALNIDGIILTKADVDEKGGTALSVSQITKKPIYFLGTGQSYDKLETFQKAKILKSLGLE